MGLKTLYLAFYIYFELSIAILRIRSHAFVVHYHIETLTLRHKTVAQLKHHINIHTKFNYRYHKMK